MQLGLALQPERALAAGRAYDEFVERVSLTGDTGKNWTGLLNSDSLVTHALVAATGTGSTTTWSTKTQDNILDDINAILSGIYTTSATIEMADTLLLPVSQYLLLATRRLSDISEISLLDWISKYNVYTATTKRALTILAVRQLAGIGAGSTDRMIAYRRDPMVVRIHIPMRHRFLPVWQTGPLVFDVPGIFRLGGTEIRRPGAVRYADGI